MRTKRVGSLLVAAALLAGCEASGQHHGNFSNVPDYLDTNLWESKAPTKPAAGSQTAVPDRSTEASR
jgi:hypothetical protein